MSVKHSTFAFLMAVAVVLSGPGLAAAEAAGHSKQEKYQLLHQLTRSSSQSAKDWGEQRKLAKAGVNPWKFIWTTDWCTRLADKPDGFDFRLSCARHDFGYRNYKKMMGKKAFRHSAHERRIDKAFLFDMRHQCAVQPDRTEQRREKCRKTAKAYYDRVSG